MATYTYFSDPLHRGFIAVNSSLLSLVSTPEVQRLRRIRQFGSGHLVFPVGEHSRFTHALGAMALMGDALRTLKNKGTPISSEERRAAMAAMLLHDIGHSPVSHALEGTLIRDTPHEAISLALMKRLAAEHGEMVGLAVQMFSQDQYERNFFHEIIAGQLDMDRLDYLRRDSSLSGVMEGRIGVARILQTMCVHPTAGGSNAHIAIEAKGLNAVENFLTARHHMYCQAYLHKTVLAADAVLIKAIERARHLIQNGSQQAVEGLSPALGYFLENDVEMDYLAHDETLDAFISLDDTDVIYSLKQWCDSCDIILADLSRRFIQRDLFRCVFLNEDPSPQQMGEWQEQIARYLRRRKKVTEKDASRYYSLYGRPSHAAYEREQSPIRILTRDGNIRDLADIEQGSSITGLQDSTVKHHFCYPKEVQLAL